MAPSAEKEYTMAEVAKHNKTEDCWLVIGNDATGECAIFLGVGVCSYALSRRRDPNHAEG